jgi:hypothetical protein
MVPGGFEEREFDVTTQLLVVGDKRQIDLNALLHGWIGKAFGNPVAVGLVGDVFVNGREVILAVGMRDVRQEFSAFVRQMQAATHEITGSTHLNRIDRGLWEHTAAKQGGNLLGIDRVVFGLTAVDGFHREGMTEDERDAGIGAEVGEPGPR